MQEAFEAYLEEHGNLAVKRSFVVTSCSPWPEKLWGMALGKTVDGGRHTLGWLLCGWQAGADAVARGQWLLAQS
jgi:hypothetical protein